MGTNQSKQSSKRTVVAIEIGSVNCGFAYSSSEKAYEIYSKSHSHILPMERMPSKFLMKDNWEIVSTGTSAAEKYRALPLQAERRQYIFFDGVNVISDTTCGMYINDFEGRRHPAEKVFEVIFKRLYLQCIDSLFEYNNQLSKNINLIVAIPTFCNDDTWDMMIHSIEQITRTCILAVYEMDAIDLYCKLQPISMTSAVDECTIPNQEEYVVVNLGGNKTEIFAKIPREKNIILDVGGESVSEAFIEELRTAIGIDKEELEAFKTEHIFDFMGVLKCFEKVRNRFDCSDDHEMIELPPSFIYAKKDNEKPSATLIVRSDNKVMIPKCTMKRLFDQLLNTIVKKLKEFKSMFKTEKVNILLSGWLSETPYVREFVSTEMNPCRVILIPNPSLALLKGAVMMGHEPYRRAKYAYGVRVIRPFLPGVDSSDMKEIRNNVVYRSDVFHTIIKKRTLIKNEQVLCNEKMEFIPKHKNEVFFLHIFKSKKDDPKYCTEISCSLLATITIDAPAGGWSCVSFVYTLIFSYTDKSILVKVESDLFKATEKEIGPC